MTDKRNTKTPKLSRRLRQGDLVCLPPDHSTYVHAHQQYICYKRECPAVHLFVIIIVFLFTILLFKVCGNTRKGRILFITTSLLDKASSSVGATSSSNNTQ
mmetsp:Transcript_11765/g.19448  ORF Transcript_11765/g.19448 Transcript_11765/m.19448 type:complete len:101 (+) Transcript_11765:303-605(+)